MAQEDLKFINSYNMRGGKDDKVPFFFFPFLHSKALFVVVFFFFPCCLVLGTPQGRDYI